MSALDQGLKRLIQIDPEQFIQRVFPGSTVQGPLATDVAMEPQRVLDTLFEGTINGDPCLFIIEGQTSYSRDDLRRFCTYANRAEDLYDKTAMLIVLWFLRDRRPPDSPVKREAGGFMSMQRNFYSIDVYRLPAHDILQEGIGALLPLVPLMQGADEAMDNDVMQAIAAEPDVERRKTLGLLSAVFIAHERGTTWAESLLRRWFQMFSELIEESPLYQKWMEEAIARGEAQGLAKGEAQGLAKGLAQGISQGISQGIAQGEVRGLAQGEATGLREAVQLMLTARFGALDADLENALQQADAALLRGAIAPATTESLAHMRTYFGLSA